MLNDLYNADFLFGNEVGEDEDIDLLKNYFFEKMDFKSRFFSDKRKLAFVRARKGVGKSALLKYTMSRYQDNNKSDIFIYVKASDLALLVPLDNETTSYDGINGWKKRICSKINMEIGSRIGLALTDDRITLVENAEIAGFKQRNLVGALVNRLSMKLKDLQISTSVKSFENPEEILKRVKANSDSNVWVFIDDIDANYVNSELKQLNISTFFTACRNLVNDINCLYIRASCRADVWNLIHDDDLDKCRQYMYDLYWSREEIRNILLNRIISYFKREYPNKYDSLTASKNSFELFELVFLNGKLKWGSVFLDPSIPINTMCAGRPRWATVLCKLAASKACQYNKDYIDIKDINGSMYTYGSERLKDLYREYNYQCDTLEKLIHAFAGGKSSYSLSEMLNFIDSNIISKIGELRIDRMNRYVTSLETASFLFRIGFISANDGKHGFLRFEDRPDLLESNINLDLNGTWEIHPSYRKVLNINKG